MDEKDAGKSLGKRQVELNPDGNFSEAEAEASVVTSNSAVEDTEKKPTKRARIVWTAELHEKFVDAVNQLGVVYARPSIIMRLMNVDGLTQSSVATHLRKYRRSVREQQLSEGGTLGAHQVSEGGNSGVDQAFFDIDNVSDAHKVFDKMSQRTWDSKSCSTQITVSSSASQHEVSSSASASNFRRLDESSRSDFTPLALDSFVQKGAKGGGVGHQHEDEDSKRALQKDKMFSILLTPSDVGELNRLVIPKHYARNYLPKFHPGDNSLLLSVEDPVGKPWIFSYMYWSSSDTYVLTQGWSRFVKDNLLQAGDTVSFYRGLGEQVENKLFISWIQKEGDAAYTFTHSTLDLDTNTSFMAETLSLAPGGSNFHDMDCHNLAQFNNNFKGEFPADWWFKQGVLPEEKDGSFNSLAIFQGKTITNKLNRFEFDSLAKLVLNIMRWRKRASARLNLDFNVGKKVGESGSLAQFNNDLINASPVNWWSGRNLSLELSGLPEEKDAGFNSYQGRMRNFQQRKLAREMRSKLESMVKLVVNIVRWKSRALSRHRNRKLIKMEDRTMELRDTLPLEYLFAESTSTHSYSYVQDMDFQLRELAGEMHSKLESMMKLVVNIVRWKRRALSRHRNRKLIKMEDRTMEFPVLLQEEYLVAESPCTLFHSDSYVRDMYWDFHSSLLLDQIPFEFDAMIVDDALFYCALFPPDHEFEKHTLVQVWMALGIFVDEPMERFGSLLFEDCLTKGYFQFLRTNLITGKAMYKFIQKTQSLPLSIGSHINLSMVSPEVTHASIKCCDLKDSIALLGFQRFKQLRALIFLHGHELSFKQVPRNFFLSLSELQVLDLSKTRLMELPTSIGNMKCLCLLDLSDTLVKRLPEAIGCLEKLQTLKLKGCLNISTLPKGMRKLVNLRHLDFDIFRQLRSMPEGMGDLANIQTLSAFLVGVEDGFSIRQIKNMNNLSGSFCISRLENVLTKDEAEEACLSNKTQLKKIELHWSDSQYEDVVGYEKILSSLQPNTSLEELNISCYGGIELPSWICDPKFSQLVCITLFEFENCLALPSLGQLPSLKYLSIVNFHKLKVIDHFMEI